MPDCSQQQSFAGGKLRSGNNTPQTKESLSPQDLQSVFVFPHVIYIFNLTVKSRFSEEVGILSRAACAAHSSGDNLKSLTVLMSPTG